MTSVLFRQSIPFPAKRKFRWIEQWFDPAKGRLMEVLGYC